MDVAVLVSHLFFEIVSLSLSFVFVFVCSFGQRRLTLSKRADGSRG